MNSKKEKLVRRHAKQLMLEWLQSVVPDEEKDKVRATYHRMKKEEGKKSKRETVKIGKSIPMTLDVKNPIKG